MKIFQANNRDEWRDWLEENHDKEKEIWLAYYKKHTQKPTISYIESVEEAICFGWIDGIKKRIDDEKYVHRFTPRKLNSKWSPVNIEIAKKMIGEGRMANAGLTAFGQRKEYDKDFLKLRSSVAENFTPEIEQVLRKNETAWINFIKLASNHRKQYILWINSAKKDETKQKRLMEAIKLLEQNKKTGMK